MSGTYSHSHAFHGVRVSKTTQCMPHMALWVHKTTYFMQQMASGRSTQPFACSDDVFITQSHVLQSQIIARASKITPNMHQMMYIVPKITCCMSHVVLKVAMAAYIMPKTMFSLPKDTLLYEYECLINLR